MSTEVLHAASAVHDTIVRVAAPDMKNGVDWAIPLITGSVAIVAGLGAQWFRSWLDDRKAHRALIVMIYDEINGIHSWAQVLSEIVDEKRPILAEHVVKLRAHTELFDRNRDRLYYLKSPTRQMLLALYHEQKALVDQAESMLKKVKERGAGGWWDATQTDLASFKAKLKDLIQLSTKAMESLSGMKGVRAYL